MSTNLQKLSTLFIMIGSVTLYAVANNPKHSVETLPPVVIKTSPVSGDLHVDAAKTKEIRVTFSKEMLDNSWSWVQLSDDTNPKITGNIRYDKEHKTCIAPVTLEPGRTYVIWINNQKYRNFKDKNKQPLVPYLLVFETDPK